jgi:malate synthase
MPSPSETENVDPEIARIAGPQLVVPVMNARYALNAANARWGSLYDALYGTDAISDEDGAGKGQRLQPEARRKGHCLGRKVSSMRAAPLEAASGDTTGRRRWPGASKTVRCAIALSDGAGKMKDRRPTASPAIGRCACPQAMLLVKNNGLHAEIVIDRRTEIGATDAAGIADVVLESALTTIHGLRGFRRRRRCRRQGRRLSQLARPDEGRRWKESFQKGPRRFVRKLNDDITYTAPDGSPSW